MNAASAGLEARVRLEHVVANLVHGAPDSVHVAEYVLRLQLGERPVILARITMLDRNKLPASVTVEQHIIGGPLHSHGLDRAPGQEVRYAPVHHARVLVLETRTGLARGVPRIAIQVARLIRLAAHNGSIMAPCICAGAVYVRRHRNEQRQTRPAIHQD